MPCPLQWSLSVHWTPSPTHWLGISSGKLKQPSSSAKHSNVGNLVTSKENVQILSMEWVNYLVQRDMFLIKSMKILNKIYYFIITHPYQKNMYLKRNSYFNWLLPLTLGHVLHVGDNRGPDGQGDSPVVGLAVAPVRGHLRQVFDGWVGNFQHEHLHAHLLEALGPQHVDTVRTRGTNNR